LTALLRAAAEFARELFGSRDAMQLESDQARGGLKGGLPISEEKSSPACAGASVVLAGIA